MFSRLPPRSTPTTTPARSRTKARSTGAGYSRYLRRQGGATCRRLLQRLPSGEPRLPVVPEVDRILAQSPTKVDLPSSTESGEVDQPLLDIAHDDAPVPEPGQLVGRGAGRGKPAGGPGIAPVATGARGHRRPVSGNVAVGPLQPHESLPHLVQQEVGGLARVDGLGLVQNEPIVCGRCRLSPRACGTRPTSVRPRSRICTTSLERGSSSPTFPSPTSSCGAGCRRRRASSAWASSAR